MSLSSPLLRRPSALLSRALFPPSCELCWRWGARSGRALNRTHEVPHAFGADKVNGLSGPSALLEDAPAENARVAAAAAGSCANWRRLCGIDGRTSRAALW